MKVTASEQNSIIVLSLEGSIMGGPDASMLNGEIHKLLEQGKQNIVLDLAGVDAMNSSGLGMLISSLTAIKNSGGQLKLAAASVKIRGLLTMTKLMAFFEHYNTVAEAVQSFS
ncbi:MAG: STAS domain-containing protein [Bacteroidota bacterium]